MLGVRRLSFGYRHSAPAVIDGLDHDFAEGAITAVTGPSGRGKSTLLYLLGLMLRPRAGQVLLDGAEASALPDGDRSGLRAAYVGFVFQDAILDAARSVLDNVMEGALYAGMSTAEAREGALALLGHTGVEHRWNHLPGEISGGQAQRVALCRALVKRPSVILADEPTGNLDEASAAVVWSVLRDRARAGATVVVATHDADVVAGADELVEL